MGVPEPTIVHANKVPEVMAFLKQQRALTEWKEKYPGAYAALRAIEKPYNSTLKAADLAVREHPGGPVSCGPFELYQYVPTLDAKAFCEAVGRPDFVRFGGEIATVDTFALDTKRFDALVVAAKVTAELASQVIAYGPRFHKPAPLTIPTA